MRIRKVEYISDGMNGKRRVNGEEDVFLDVLHLISIQNSKRHDFFFRFIRVKKEKEEEEQKA